MKAFFLLSCLLLFMASGDNQTTDSPTSSSEDWDLNTESKSTQTADQTTLPTTVVPEYCISTCTEEFHKQCVWKNVMSWTLECECIPGYIEKDKDGTCRECDFGYSGVDCKDKYILILTVVCIIGGAALLATIIGLIVLSSSKKRRRSTEENPVISRDFDNVKLETTGFNTPGFNNPASSTGSLFPWVNSAPLPRVQSNVQSNPYKNGYTPRSIPERDY